MYINCSKFDYYIKKKQKSIYHRKKRAKLYQFSIFIIQIQLFLICISSFRNKFFLLSFSRKRLKHKLLLNRRLFSLDIYKTQMKQVLSTGQNNHRGCGTRRTITGGGLCRFTARLSLRRSFGWMSRLLLLTRRDAGRHGLGSL